jgi:hypothetical protein
MNVHSWIRRLPHPAYVEADGKKIVLGDGKRKWADCVASVQAINPLRLTAFDKDGAIIRACELRSGGEVDEEEAKEEDGKLGSDIVLLARLLSRHADMAAARHENAYRYAFDVLAQIVQTYGERINALEIARERIYQDRNSVLEQLIASGKEDSLADIVGLIQGKKDAPTNGKKAS